jgi:hypothetical protein
VREVEGEEGEEGEDEEGEVSFNWKLTYSKCTLIKSTTLLSPQRICIIHHLHRHYDPRDSVHAQARVFISNSIIIFLSYMNLLFYKCIFSRVECIIAVLLCQSRLKLPAFNIQPFLIHH